MATPTDPRPLGRSDTSSDFPHALYDAARRVVEAWESLPDQLPDINGIVPLSQAVIQLRALVRSDKE